jgi:hypothetical protein
LVLLDLLQTPCREEERSVNSYSARTCCDGWLLETIEDSGFDVALIADGYLIDIFNRSDRLNIWHVACI